MNNHPFQKPSAWMVFRMAGFSGEAAAEHVQLRFQMDFVRAHCELRASRAMPETWEGFRTDAFALRFIDTKAACNGISGGQPLHV